MSLKENITSEQFIDKQTEKRFILFTDSEMENGFISNSDFSVQKVLDDDDHFFGVSNMGSWLDFKKTKHAYIYSTSDYAMEADTVLNLKDLKDLKSIKTKELYIVPLIIGKDVEYDSILEKEGIDNILEWFDAEDPFLNVFNQIHYSLGNNPKDFIL